jgi:hypothetical protein
MYEAALIAADGDVMYDATSPTIDEVWDVVNDYGSAWHFYPVRVVVEQETDRIASVCDGLPTEWNGGSLTELVKELTVGDLSYLFDSLGSELLG